jgi:2'-5' RNA ligase
MEAQLKATRINSIQEAPMPRLFSGFEIPANVSAKLALLRGGLPGARWMEPEDYHVTLRFFGDVNDLTANAIAEELAASARAPLALTVSELGVFGGDRPRAIIARIKPDAALTQIQAEHERIARRQELAPETRKFSPHITLARLRGVAPDAVAAYLAARTYPLALRFEADRFVLYSAKQSVGGGPYLVEAAFPLIAGPVAQSLRRVT